MKVIYLTEKDQIKEPNLALCLGFFDGMHIAHQRLFNQTLLYQKNQNYQTGLLTFSTHILSYIYQKPFRYLTSTSDKIKIAEQMNFDYFYVLNVEDALIKMDPCDFINQYLSTAKEVIVGYDYTFGRFGKGNTTLLEQQNSFHTTVIPEFDYYQKKIGSTRIRELIQSGKLSFANRLLGRNYTITGCVIKGKSRGALLGYPTANIDYQDYLLPKNGVYLTKTFVDDKPYYGMTNVGINPTFQNDGITVENYLFDFQGNLYQKNITIEFIEYIREERYFTSLDLLKSQIQSDEQFIKNRLEERKLK